MSSFVKILPLALLVLLMSACSNVKLEEKNDIASSNAVSSLAYDPIADSKTNVYGKRSIYFDFDSYSVDPKYAPVITSHATYLKTLKKDKVVILIQGNTDDRGTAEYNLALGQRRSEAVKRALISQGVSESQVEAVSFGKEKPVNSAQTEKAYQENRRADFVYQLN